MPARLRPRWPARPECRPSSHVLAAALLAAALLWAAPAQAADPVIVAAGDVACDPGSSSFNNGLGVLDPAPGRCHQKYTSDLFTSLAPTHVLALGDIQYEDGRYDKYVGSGDGSVKASYDARDAAGNQISWGRAKAITRPVPGNHEYGSGSTNYDVDATGYFTYFNEVLTPYGQTATSPSQGYYSFHVPAGTRADGTPFNWHIVAINSECAAGLANVVGWTGGCDVGSAQEEWLRAELAASPSDCTLAYWHHPLYSSGGIGNNPVMKPIWKALYDDYADIVLTGHDHNYERFALQDADGNAAPDRGIREWVVGTGGKSLLPLGSLKANSQALSNDTHGVLKLTLHPPNAEHRNGWYEWRFVSDGFSGTYTDTGSGDCVEPPPAASSVSPARGATGVSTGTGVSVTFNEPMDKPASQSAFSLARSSDGSPVAGVFSWSDNTMTFRPSAALAQGTQYTAKVTTGATDLAGNALAADESWTFKTATSVTAFPGAAPVLTGKYRSCSPSYLRSDDNVFCSFDSTTSGVRVSAWYGRFSGVPKSLQNLRVTYKGKNSRGCTQTLAIQRISDGAWITLDTRGVGPTEALIADKAPPGSPAGYVDGSGYLRVRVRCATSSWSFTSSGDLMKISYQRP
jgi:acid phosphatase type 7